MPILGFGTWDIPPAKTYETVKLAIEKGYRHIDTAFIYGNEKEVGKAINDLIHEGKIKREDVFVVTKVWNSFHERQSVVKSVNISLTNLGLKYIDLMLIHWPMGFKDGMDPFPKDKNGTIIFSDVDYLETWAGLEEAKHMGLVKSIGISNFNSKQVERIIKNSKTPPAVNQVIEFEI